MGLEWKPEVLVIVRSADTGAPLGGPYTKTADKVRKIIDDKYCYLVDGGPLYEVVEAHRNRDMMEHGLINQVELSLRPATSPEATEGGEVVEGD